MKMINLALLVIILILVIYCFVSNKDHFYADPPEGDANVINVNSTTTSVQNPTTPPVQNPTTTSVQNPTTPSVVADINDVRTVVKNEPISLPTLNDDFLVQHKISHGQMENKIDSHINDPIIHGKLTQDQTCKLNAWEDSVDDEDFINKINQCYQINNN
tara:strand:- start:713 stop:1189 length:477 start_codon:yes stop_codon:yes gene_type:complete